MPTGSAATTPAAVVATNPADPWEAWNRKVFAFNESVDEAVLKPVARVYRDVVPQLVRTGVSNFFGNIGDVWSTANHFLQGKVGTGLEMGMRVLSIDDVGFTHKAGSLFMSYLQQKEGLRAKAQSGTLGALGLTGIP